MVAYRAIENSKGDIQLSDLINENTKQAYFKPALEFKNVKEDYYWDNSTYVYNFLQGLKKKKKDVKKELKMFCIKNGLDYKSTKEDLIWIFKTSKKLNFWK